MSASKADLKRRTVKRHEAGRTPVKRQRLSWDNLEAVGRHLVETVIPPLRDGLSAYNKISDALLRLEVDLITHGTRPYLDIRDLIKEAQQSLEFAEETTSVQLKDLDGSLEDMTAKQYKLKQEREKKTLDLDNLRTKQKSNISTLNTYKDSLNQGKRNLDSAKATLRRQQYREDTADTVMKVGAGVTLIPIVGWVAGPFMMIGGALEKIEAEKAVRVAEEEVSRSESQVRTYSDKVSEYEDKISQTKKDISQMDEELKQVGEKIEEVRGQREALVEFQEKMRSAVHLLGRLSGTANVLELQTRRFILLEPVMKVMEDVVKVAGKITGNQVLQDEGVMSLVDAMRQDSKRLADVCGSDNNPALENLI